MVTVAVSVAPRWTLFGWIRTVRRAWQHFWYVSEDDDGPPLEDEDELRANLARAREAL